MDAWTYWGLMVLAGLVGSVLGTLHKRARQKRKAAREGVPWEEISL
jgi:hypothetical protein